MTVDGIDLYNSYRVVRGLSFMLLVINLYRPKSVFTQLSDAVY